jgi:hypothetical protein
VAADPAGDTIPNMEMRASPRNIRWGVPDPSWDEGPLDARTATLLDVIEGFGVKSFNYLYDFGDSSERKIKIGRIAEPEEGVSYPRLIKAAGRCPPEDVGGPWGYAKYLEAMADPNHERHDGMVEWRGSDFDPKIVDIVSIENALAKLSLRPAHKKTEADAWANVRANAINAR